MMIYPISTLTFFKLFYFYIVFNVFILLVIIFEYNIISIRAIKATAFMSLLNISFLVSSYWGLNPAHSYNELFYFSIYLLEFFIFCYVLLLYNNQQIARVISFLPLGLFILNIIFIFTYGTIRADDRLIKSILKSYSNEMTAYSEFCLPILLYSYKYLKDRKKIISLLLIIITIVNILLSQSRGGYMVLVIIMIFAPFLIGQTTALSLLKTYFTYALLSILTIFILFSIPTTKTLIVKGFERIAATTSEASQMKLSKKKLDREGTVRILMYIYGSQILNKHFITGLGFRNFKNEMEKKFRAGVIPHNIFLEAISHGGVLALGILLYLIFKTFINLYRLFRFYKQEDESRAYWYLAFLFTFFIVIIHGQFRPTLDTTIFYMPIAVAFMDIYKIKKTQPLEVNNSGNNSNSE